MRDVLRVGFALASVGVGVCDLAALGGVWHSKSGYFLACCLVLFVVWRAVCGAVSLQVSGGARLW